MEAIHEIVEKIVEERIRIRDHERIAKVKASNLKNYRAWCVRNPDLFKERQERYRLNAKKKKEEKTSLAIKNCIEIPCV